MNFREIKQEDIDFVAEHSISRGVLSKQPERTDWSYALEHEGKVLGVGGIRLINNHTAWAWVDTTEYAREHLKTGYRVVREWMEIICKEMGIVRLQAYVEVGFEEAERMVKHLGFEKESVMRNFVGSKSAYLFVRIMKWDN